MDTAEAIDDDVAMQALHQTDFERFEVALEQEWREKPQSVSGDISRRAQKILCEKVFSEAQVRYPPTCPFPTSTSFEHPAERAAQKPGRYHCITVELCMGEKQKKAYEEAHLACIANIVIDPTGSTSLKKHEARPLRAMALNSELGKFFDRTDVAESVMAFSFRPNYGNGAVFYHQVTKAQEKDLPYADRYSMAVWMSHESVKLRYLTGICNRVILEQNAKLLVYGSGTLEMWHIGCFLSTLGFKVLNVRPSDSEEEQEKVESQFSLCDILLTTKASTFKKTNLKVRCGYVVCIDVASSAHIATQLLEQQLEPVQEHSIYLWFLTCDNTIDQVDQANIAKKLTAQITRTHNIKVTPEDLDREITARGKAGIGIHDLTIKLRTEGNIVVPALTVLEGLIKEDICDKKSRAIYRRLMGQRSDRQEWMSLIDVGEKDYFPGEDKAGEQNPYLLPISWTKERREQRLAARQARLDKLIVRSAIESAKFKALDAREWLKAQREGLIRQGEYHARKMDTAGHTTVTYMQQPPVPAIIPNVMSKRMTREPGERFEDGRVSMKLNNTAKQTGSTHLQSQHSNGINDKTQFTAEDSDIGQSSPASATPKDGWSSGVKRKQDSEVDGDELVAKRRV